MAVVPQIFNGLKGIREADLPRELPLFGFTNGGLNKPALKLNWTKTNNLENMTSLRQSVLLTNMGGVRGVMPCKGAISVGFAGGATRTLRRPAIPYQGGLYPQQGYARGQMKGLAYQVEKPINQPLLPLANSFNAGMNSTLGQPQSINAMG
jgi:hypothetical protein